VARGTPRGDWYDAYMIYRDWVTQHAAWYPKIVDGKRVDTPQWMRDIGAWVQMGDFGHEVVGAWEIRW